MLFLLNLTSSYCQTTQNNTIHIEPKQFDFGLIDEGIEVNHDFYIVNDSNHTIKIENAYATCGCTTPQLTNKILKPHQKSLLKITVDTTMKTGNITKSVFVICDEKTNPKLEVKLLMNVKDPHKNLTKEKMAKIFTSEKCNTCHVLRGTGLFGQKLYNADCAMCHGPKAEGAVGPKLFGPYYDEKFKQKMTTITSKGSPNVITMPGFLVDNGGPLSKEQIDSIIEYLSSISKKRNYK